MSSIQNPPVFSQTVGAGTKQDFKANLNKQYNSTRNQLRYEIVKHNQSVNTPPSKNNPYVIQRNDTDIPNAERKRVLKVSTQAFIEGDGCATITTKMNNIGLADQYLDEAKAALGKNDLYRARDLINSAKIKLSEPTGCEI